MSVYNIKSRVLQNRDANPPVLSNPELSRGLTKSALGVQRTSEFGSDLPEAGSQFRLITVPSNARLQSLEHGMSNLGTSSLDVAAWYPADIKVGAFGGPANSLENTLISSSVFATAIAGLTGGRSWSDSMGASTAPLLQNRAFPLWQMLGLSSDPGLSIDLGFVVRSGIALNGYVGLRATYVD